ncbi:MAG: diguanylate cyclase [Desulfobacterales bacterium]|nr:diguanylate cyclase [Desulfobacterales bacterium]MCP4161959.1 diguanylate cyclase [Deltaproteobacteria bacterium]
MIVDSLRENDSAFNVLFQNPELEIIKCESGHDALKAFSNHEFALILLDVGVPPARNGFKIAELIRQRKKSYEIPIILISDDEALVFKGYEAGAVDYLFKPINPVIIEKKVEFFVNIYRQKKENERTKAELKANLTRVENSKREIEKNNIELKHISKHDNLTGLYNQRHMVEINKIEFERARRYERDISCLMIDLDYFKEVNDSCGHQFGDFVLQDLSESIKEHLRESDFAFRYGGEEFMVLLPQTDIDGAYATAEKLRLFCRDHIYDNGTHITMVTISIGVSSLLANKPKNPEELILFADKALYKAKSEGRNLVERYKSTNDDPFAGDIIGLKNRIESILDRTKQSAISSIEILVKETGGEIESHNKRVLEYIEKAGKKMRMPKTIVDPFKRAAILHDCFKHLMGQSVNTSNVLSPEDRAILESYPYMLGELTELFDFFANERSVLLFHHENYDGSGYPEGLKGAEIPLGARIFSIADSVVAMLSDRPHRSKKNIEDVISELKTNAGKQFDPNIVEIFLSILNEQKTDQT